MTTSPVLLGLGDDEEGVRALRWAVTEAAQRRAELHIVRSYHVPSQLLPWETAGDRMITESFQHAAETRLRRAVHRANEMAPELVVRAEAVEAIPWQALLEREADAALTVLGARQHGLLKAAIVGSVSTVVAARATRPVVVMAGPPGDPAEEPAVVVGVDGSAQTEAVLAFAFDHASRHGRPLLAVYCWPVVDVLAETSWAPPAPAPERADRWLAEMIAGWGEKYPDVAVHRSIVRGHPVAALVDASATQDLLVVGAHAGHARVAALLGSVSQGVLHHATCPVAIVH